MQSFINKYKYEFIQVAIVLAIALYGYQQMWFQDYATAVSISGEIGASKDASMANIAPLLDKAFHDSRSKGVVIKVNSPGGSPVQSSLIHNHIQRLKKETGKSVVIVGEDMLTSGAYLIASAGDKIYVNDSTLIGSIGVIYTGFGFTETMKKLGIERRAYHAGDSKNSLDPFSPMKPEDKAHIDGLLTDIHKQFIGYVKAGRPKLIGPDNVVFSGAFWTGAQGRAIGLADKNGDVRDALQNEFGVTKVKAFSQKPPILKAIFGNLSEVLVSTETEPRVQLKAE